MIPMQVTLKNPTLARFIEDEVAAGHYPSVDDAIEAAVEQLMIADPPDADALAAIEESDRQIARGESIDFDAFKAKVQQKHGLA